MISKPADAYMKLFDAHLTHEVGEAETHNNCGKPPSNEPLPCLLGAQLNQRSPAHREAKHVGHDVVDDDHHDGHDEPDEPLKHVLDDEVALGDHAEQSNMGPRKK